MESVNYANIANELLGNELYCEFLREISKEHDGANLLDFANQVLEKVCFLIVMIGMNNKIQLDKVKICLEDKIVEISCKEFAKKYELYVKKIEQRF